MRAGRPGRLTRIRSARPIRNTPATGHIEYPAPKVSGATCAPRAGSIRRTVPDRCRGGRREAEPVELLSIRFGLDGDRRRAESIQLTSPSRRCISIQRPRGPSPSPDHPKLFRPQARWARSSSSRTRTATLEKPCRHAQSTTDRIKRSATSRPRASGTTNSEAARPAGRYAHLRTPSRPSCRSVRRPGKRRTQPAIAARRRAIHRRKRARLLDRGLERLRRRGKRCQRNRAILPPVFRPQLAYVHRRPLDHFGRCRPLEPPVGSRSRDASRLKVSQSPTMGSSLTLPRVSVIGSYPAVIAIRRVVAHLSGD